MEETRDNSDDDEEGADAPFGEGDSIPNTSCLFCATASSGVEDNLKHMSSIHSFFVPDLEYLVDVEGTNYLYFFTFFSQLHLYLISARNL